MSTYRKLVRDRIPELIRRTGGEPRTRRLSDEEFGTALARKLVEEAQEFAATPTAEELADVLEVAHALAQVVGISVDEVDALRRAKAAKRGAFDERLLLESVSYPDRSDDERTTPGVDTDSVRLYNELLQRGRADDNVLGLILAGSRGADIFVTDRSDFDAYLILGSSDEGWRADHGAPVEVWPMTIDEFRQHALVGEPDAWNRPTFLYARVEIDKLDGEIHQLVEQKSRLIPDEVDRIVPDALDGYINSLYRSLKSLEAGRQLEGRLDALESLSTMLTTVFALEGRVRPFNKYLRHELEARPLPTLGLEAIERFAREATRDDQRAVFRDVERRARSRLQVGRGWLGAGRGVAARRTDLMSRPANRSSLGAPSLAAGSQVRVRLAKSVHRDVEYDAIVISDDGNHIVVRGPWSEEEPRDLAFVRFEPGDMFTEHYWRDRWYSIKEVRTEGGVLKGWYCDVARPVRAEAGALVSEDLELDLWVSADGRTMLRLDEDEFAASGLAETDPDAAIQAREALAELERLARGGFAGIAVEDDPGPPDQAV